MNVVLRIFAYLSLLLLMAQQVPPSPTVRAFGDNKFWVTVEDMVYVVGQTQDRIVVPKGFVTDFASIPKILWSTGLSPHGQYSRAAVIHDFLCWSQACTRAQADRLLVIAMKESKVSTFDDVVVYAGVSIGGEAPWLANQAESRAGLPRILPEQFLRPADPNIDWPSYRQQLFEQAIKDPSFEVNPSYCRHGDSTNVP